MLPVHHMNETPKPQLMIGCLSSSKGFHPLTPMLRQHHAGFVNQVTLGEVSRKFKQMLEMRNGSEMRSWVQITSDVF